MSTEASNGVRANGTLIQASADGVRRHERPWLLPSNRKLRHLQGISFRNLTLSQQSQRTRGQTIDDESLPQTWKSPAKRLAQQDGVHHLEHSRSISDLKPMLSSPGSKGRPGVGSSNVVMNGGSPQRPSQGRRRRSTMTWGASNAEEREKKIEDWTSKLVDTWFSLHCEGFEDPIYISEIMEKTMNPTFRFFDLNSCGPLVTRLDSLTVKVWSKSKNMATYQLLLQLELHLKSLQFIGKSLDNFHHPLPNNCVVFHLSDGVYTSFTDLASDDHHLPVFEGPKSIGQNVQSTSSYDALMRLSNLDNVIQDAFLTRENLASQINSILKKNQDALATISRVSESGDSLTTTERYLATARKQLKSAQRARSTLQSSLVARRAAIQSGRESQERIQSDLQTAKTKLSQCRNLITETHKSIDAQRRRICTDLQTIYPIEPIPDSPLAFTICDLPLPNSDFDSADPDITAAALGAVAHVVYLLSFYLFVPLPYPLQPCASTSLIADPISLLPHSTSEDPPKTPPAGSTPAGTGKPPPPHRTYPLYAGRVPRFRFDYAVFLLNKNVEALMAARDLQTLDIRHTLPNLKYLLYVLTAGEGEMPERKKGGVRGLLRGRVGLGDGVLSARGGNGDGQGRWKGKGREG